MNKHKSKLQTAIEYVFSHPGCRSGDLAKIFNTEAKNVPDFMKDVLASGLIISCKIERPGESISYEYKPSAAAPDKCPTDWLDWKRANIAPPPKPLKFNATGPRDGLQKSGSARETQAVSGDVTTAAAVDGRPLGMLDLPGDDAAIETQAGSHGPEEALASVSAPAVSAQDAPIGLHISLDNGGCLTLGELKFSPADTRSIGQFLIDTEPAWA